MFHFDAVQLAVNDSTIIAKFIEPVLSGSRGCPRNAGFIVLSIYSFPQGLKV